MKKVKSYLKHSKQRRVSKDIEFLEKKSNGRQKLILDICFYRQFP